MVFVFATDNSNQIFVSSDGNNALVSGATWTPSVYGSHQIHIWPTGGNVSPLDSGNNTITLT